MADVVIAGCGAAGMMAGVAAAEAGNTVSIYEKNEKAGKKLFITGKGRCNLTNACEESELASSVVSNPKFLYSSFSRFSNRDVCDFMEKNHCPVKVERGNRVFPESDHSSDVIHALTSRLAELGVRIFLNEEVKDLMIEDGCAKGIILRKNDRAIAADAVIVATGGLACPATGSTGDGYRFAREAGHTVTPLSPALVPFKVKEKETARLAGLSLKNVRIRIYGGEKLIYEDFGEMLFTHEGVSGPIILSASSHAASALKKGDLRLSIDLKPALSEDMLDARILRDFAEEKNRQFKNSLGGLLPKSLIPLIVGRSGIQPEKMVNQVKHEERMGLVRLMKDFSLTLTQLSGYDEAVITQGGVSVKEIDPSTMESKLIKNLYFAGEVIDVDALTGGFNLQIAWSTGHLAGSSICQVPAF